MDITYYKPLKILYMLNAYNTMLILRSVTMLTGL